MDNDQSLTTKLLLAKFEQLQNALPNSPDPAFDTTNIVLETTRIFYKTEHSPALVAPDCFGGSSSH